MSRFSVVVLCCVTDFRGFSVNSHSHTGATMATHFGKKPSKLSPLCLISAQLYLWSFVGFCRTCSLHNILSYLEVIFRFRFWFRCGREQSHENLRDSIYLQPYLSLSQSWTDGSEKGSFEHCLLITWFSSSFHLKSSFNHSFPSAAADWKK